MAKTLWAKYRQFVLNNYKTIIISACAAYALVTLASSMTSTHSASTQRHHVIRDVSNRIENDNSLVSGESNLSQEHEMKNGESLGYKVEGESSTVNYPALAVTDFTSPTFDEDSTTDGSSSTTVESDSDSTVSVDCNDGSSTLSALENGSTSTAEYDASSTSSPSEQDGSSTSSASLDETTASEYAVTGDSTTETTTSDVPQASTDVANAVVTEPVVESLNSADAEATVAPLRDVVAVNDAVNGEITATSEVTLNDKPSEHGTTTVAADGTSETTTSVSESTTIFDSEGTTAFISESESTTQKYEIPEAEEEIPEAEEEEKRNSEVDGVNLAALEEPSNGQVESENDATTVSENSELTTTQTSENQESTVTENQATEAEVVEGTTTTSSLSDGSSTTSSDSSSSTDGSSPYSDISSTTTEASSVENSGVKVEKETPEGLKEFSDDKIEEISVDDIKKQIEDKVVNTVSDSKTSKLINELEIAATEKNINDATTSDSKIENIEVVDSVDVDAKEEKNIELGVVELEKGNDKVAPPDF